MSLVAAPHQQNGAPCDIVAGGIPPEVRGRDHIQDRVLFPLSPIHGESLQGFIARTSAWNFIERPLSILSRAGIGKHRDLSRAIAPNAAAVAHCLGIAEADLQAMLNYGEPNAGAYVDFFGTRLKRLHIEKRARRVSPTALRLSPFHRARWLVSPLPYCAEGWDLLIDHCPRCTGQLGWVTTLGVEICEHCAFDLREATSAEVPPPLRQHLGALAALVSPSPEDRAGALEAIPSEFGRLSAWTAIDLILTCVNAKLEGDRFWRHRRLSIEDLEWGARIVFEFPASVRALPKAGENSARDLFSRRLSTRDVEQNPELALPLHTLLDAHEPIRHGPTRLKAMREASGKVTLKMAARSLGVTHGQLQALTHAGAFPASGARGIVRKAYWFSPEDVEAVRHRLRQRIFASEFSRRYGLPICGVEQLVSAGVLILHRDVLVGSIFDGLQLERRSAERFLRQLRSGLRPLDPEQPALTITDMFMAVGASEKPWGPVLTALVRGELPGKFACRPGSPLRIEELIVEPEFAREFQKDAYPNLLRLPERDARLGPPADMRRTEVERYLNCFPRDVSWLLANDHLTFVSDGGLISRADVTRLGRKLISSREITWRWRISPTLREELPRAHGIARSVGPFWPRNAVTEHFRTLFPTGSPR